MYNLAFDTTGAQCAVILRKDEKTLDLYSKFTEFDSVIKKPLLLYFEIWF